MKRKREPTTDTKNSKRREKREPATDRKNGKRRDSQDKNNINEGHNKIFSLPFDIWKYMETQKFMTTIDFLKFSLTSKTLFDYIYPQIVKKYIDVMKERIPKVCYMSLNDGVCKHYTFVPKMKPYHPDNVDTRLEIDFTNQKSEHTLLYQLYRGTYNVKTKVESEPHCKNESISQKRIAYIEKCDKCNMVRTNSIDEKNGTYIEGSLELYEYMSNINQLLGSYEGIYTSTKGTSNGIDTRLYDMLIIDFISNFIPGDFCFLWLDAYFRTRHVSHLKNWISLLRSQEKLSSRDQSIYNVLKMLFLYNYGSCNPSVNWNIYTHEIDSYCNDKRCEIGNCVICGKLSETHCVGCHVSMCYRCGVNLDGTISAKHFKYCIMYLHNKK